MSTDMFSSGLETFFGLEFGRVQSRDGRHVMEFRICGGRFIAFPVLYNVSMNLCQFKCRIIVIYYVLAFC